MLVADKAKLDGLVLAVARRDRAAFGRLYDLTSPKLFGTILRIVRQKSTAEEVLQDVYLRVWQNAEHFSPQAGSASVWMNSIARNRAIDVIRQRSSVTFSGERDNVDWFERIAEDRDREAEMVDIASLRHCLGEIDEQARECVLLAYYDGLSRDELSRRFDRPVNTIKTWLHRSLSILRSCLEGPRS